MKLNLFVKPGEKRLRAGWRILLFLIVMLLITRIVNTGVKMAAAGFPPDKTGWMWWALRGIIVVVSATLAVWVSRRFVDKKSLKSLGLQLNGMALKDFLVGAALSWLMVGIIFAILFYAGMIEVTGIGIKKLGFSFVLWLILWFWGTGLAVGWSEELIFRGYLLQNLKEGIGLVWAVVLSCVFYGAVHMANPNSSLLSGILIAILGYVRIFGWLRTGQLWLSMGMHASWNFFQGPVFGFHVSGMKVHNLISHQATGPDWITGGVFGPEAGIVVLPAILLGLLGMYFYSTARKNTPLLEWKIRAAQ